MNDEQLHQSLIDFVQTEGLPGSYLELIYRYLFPLSDWIAEHKQAGQAFTFAVNGAQGSGKSTLCAAMSILLEHRFDYSVAILSIDDLYLNRDRRHQLAEEIHPLFITRGVPGTHDVQLGLDVLSALKKEEAVQLPRFDKINDNPFPERQWPVQDRPVDIILFEGWCLGLSGQTDALLHQHVNKLEADEDEQRVWRNYANEQLRGSYQLLFSELDALLYLKSPNMDAIRRWRGEQEARLSHAKTDLQMDLQQLLRFMQHFERLTNWASQTLPDSADIVFELDEYHQVNKVKYR
ncbi:D-glycerate 3-kinase [Mariprofundus micogutta]|uniref:D-glycerate 3-kinase n=1 Tax=Mariprofundus micogutta TaxID=1921010 RepID=A0A1L8CQ93_9PROT|nr:hypothetical protein [Mariprofundus micogutta]GAV21096.1 D-glycerate 3-kinase [Mariprofundus micogutta]